ncbi:hypothetical protein BDV95DRAFT_497619 [Massariosphaeria phaeospora]|uniref:Uncharacterized protein n=1 Tax=Massariosphaeria phaeospora TaxID=100035 RepID=A0A7C8I716_9PLEO|nr:hypothetical protein BDV95DRAFT_497619 [Massariosphaeria phaeospora]
MRRGPPIRDHRNIRQKPLRTTEPLPLREWSTDEEELHFYEAQTSSLSLGPDEWFWTEYFLVDTYFGSEQKLHEYIANYPSGDGFDPPLGGRGTMNPPCFDPREYWLFKVDRRVHQVTVEYTSLIETFNKRMEEYARHIRQVFQDDPSRTHTETLSNVIETVQIFVDCISAIIDAWDTFYRNQISFFTTFARDKPTWPRIIDSIIRSMAELDRLRKLLLTKRDRFRFKFDSYVAFPLLFTTALFGMEFLKPRYPWIFFFAVLLPTSLANYVIASDRSLSHVFRDSQRWLQARH